MRTNLKRGTVALCALVPSLLSLDASAHAIAGNRVFPATMAVDDPGVGDEVNFEFGHVKSEADDGSEFNTNTTTLEWDKLITPSFQLSVTATYVNINAPDGGARGFDNWQVGAKYRFYVNEKHEFRPQSAQSRNWATPGRTRLPIRTRRSLRRSTPARDSVTCPIA